MLRKSVSSVSCLPGTASSNCFPHKQHLWGFKAFISVPYVRPCARISELEEIKHILEKHVD